MNEEMAFDIIKDNQNRDLDGSNFILLQSMNW